MAAINQGRNKGEKEKEGQRLDRKAFRIAASYSLVCDATAVLRKLLRVVLRRGCLLGGQTRRWVASAGGGSFVCVSSDRSTSFVYFLYIRKPSTHQRL